MEEKFEPLMSLELIQQTINEAKMRFQENGFLYIFWGAIILLCSVGQFVLEQNHVPHPYLIWLLTVLGSIFTFYYYYRKEGKTRKTKNVISSILYYTGMIVGANIFILGFGFWPYLGQAFTPVVIVFLSLYGMIVGKALQFRFMFIMALICNVLGFGLFFLDLQYHPLGTAFIAFFLLLLPGIIIYRKNKA